MTRPCPPRPRAVRASRSPVLLPRAVMTVGLVALLSTFLYSVPALSRLSTFVLTWLVPLPVLDWFTAVVILILGSALSRRLRAAWLATTVLAVLSIVLFVLAGTSLLLLPEVDIAVLDLLSLGFNALMLVLLVVLLLRDRSAYRVRMRPGNLRRALTVTTLGIGASTALTALAVLVIHPSALTGLFLAGDPHPLIDLVRQFPDWALSLLGLGWALSFLTGLATLLRSQRLAARMSVEEEERVRTLLAAHPQDSLGYFATRRDKSVLLTEHGAVAYRPSLGVALVSGDPLGDPATWPATVAAFSRHCASYGLTPAVIGASEAGARAWVQGGLHALHIGDEAVLRPARFRLGELAEVRQAMRHASGAGYTARVRRHRSIPVEELTGLSALATTWLNGEAERGFSMALGRSLDDPSDGESVLVEALFPDGDERGRVAALLSFAPWGADGLSLDVMRRHPEADHGVTELMVSTLMAEAAPLSVTRVSLNFAVFRDVFAQGARLGAGPIQRARRQVLLLASRWWQLESLYRSNSRYEPDWVPRLLCYTDGGDLARVSAAVAVAEGFLRPPGPLCGQEWPQPRLSEEDSARMLALTRAVPEPRPAARVPREVRERAACRERMLSHGLTPYPAVTTVTTGCARALDAGGERTVAGRVVGLRDHGGVLFADLRDWGGQVQVLLERGTAPEALTGFRRLVRTGDQVTVTGAPGASRTGTPSLVATGWAMASKALRPLPDKHRGLADPEALVRQRHLTLITSSRQRHLVEARSRAVQAVRSRLLERGYLEVETPILQPVHGGANARPFRTHINAYDLDLYLRIAPELYLKRLVVGGMDRVFEIGRSFRNEGADSTHNPEFTMLEAYQAYADYEVMKTVVHDLVVSAAREALGTTVVRGTVGGIEHEVDLAQPWRTVSVCDAVSHGLGEQVTTSTPTAVLRSYAERLGLRHDPSWGWGTLVQELYEHLAESSTVQPTFFSDFPAQTSPLTRPHRGDLVLAERWDLIIFGSEVGTAYSELVDPVIQRERLTAQSLAAASGDPEAMELDEAFLEALEQGMAPSGGLGVGVDRLVMMLTGASIRETITFPLVRPSR
ncbi:MULTISPECIES: bifunctional lysylphosphatidylglycerol synthetase/lysine--tRNA ligase LysX [unclassified Actinomyces]|uniref:bifunctional lysylphosphatidylglycerol synthetase/lysine--tRNA ligase LysX n=1 Tax=unclassified Actinomyces TaxID=2609248 RepID=UPI002016D170|nr:MULTISPECIES: bifunctional lysylphosphatidylglycerol synthetase/lysine--tRNA ligase LysX [unclassified Actinomyces]MCL3777017.1 bifunctional lysylphosphatidylglycerol synthetase/lysine--tRNA ligase LysX [Actinomyces sp. AC-20-1]MCL3789348.1 bifunctional lysylphosphatidylglycerol synthetase/lysine--tRNA ligase LysX [Actinomyces sp. 187325]MCL3791238.1 bifunctional lysylphosphatidylglycerol synthetase/lysine--tRNA ligase LysX [Actinomyces sp. 186855]MCL3793741.1 bifunctional lysylphosphatidylg